MNRIYLDHAATTPLKPQVRQAMATWLSDEFGNPSSLHRDGRNAKDAIDLARESISKRLGCLFAEVIFTASGTEAANLALLGTALGHKQGRHRVLLGAAEHHAVLHMAPLLARLGYSVELIPVDHEARVTPDALHRLLGEDVLLVAVMHANNELGTIQPVAQLVEAAHQAGALMFVDAVQTFGDRTWDVTSLGADLIAASAHKIGGPKGAGMLYIRAGTPVEPLVRGGGQEREMRAGTENVAAIVGFGAAVQALVSNDGSKRAARDRFAKWLDEAGIGAIRTVSEWDHGVLPGHAHVRIPGIAAETMLIVLDRLGISASSGAACSSGSLEPSHVLLACGYPVEAASEGLRFTFGDGTSLEDAEKAAQQVIRAAQQIRAART